MQISTVYQAYSPRGVLSSQKSEARETPASPAASAASSPTAVTISGAARALASQPASDPSLSARALQIRNAEGDPAYARKRAEEFAYYDGHEKYGPLVDITHDPIRYSATGEVVTEESLAAFKEEAAKVTAGRIALYQAEKAKGTPDVQILEKLFAYVDGQSDNYLGKLGWTRAAPQAEAAADTGLPEGIKRMLDRMVDDPAYGAEMAAGYASNMHTACMTLPEFMRSEGRLEAGRQQLETAWRGIASTAKTPAQGYAELLRYELSMGDSHWQAMDPGRAGPDVRKLAEAKLAYLEARIAAGV